MSEQMNKIHEYIKAIKKNVTRSIVKLDSKYVTPGEPSYYYEKCSGVSDGANENNHITTLRRFHCGHLWNDKDESRTGQEISEAPRSDMPPEVHEIYEKTGKLIVCPDCASVTCSECGTPNTSKVTGYYLADEQRHVCAACYKKIKSKKFKKKLFGWLKPKESNEPKALKAPKQQTDSERSWW